jgi:hypothetical protein
VPLQAVELIGNGKWFIYLFDDGDVQQLQIDVGTVRGDQIEIVTELPEGAEIITSDMSSVDLDTVTIEKR